MSAFGFDAPQGDPGALDAAAGAWRALGLALDGQGQHVGSGAEVAIGAGGWDGPAAGAFSGNAERLIGSLGANVQACETAASALTQLAQALERAQLATRQALAECERANGELATQQSLADEAGSDAESARLQSAAAVHPAVAKAKDLEATEADERQRVAQGAADQARGDLSTAQTQGREAVTAYEQESAAAVRQLHAAAGQLRPAEEDKGWAEPIVTWAGHINDYAGAGAVGLRKGYDQAIKRATDKLNSEIEDYLGDPVKVSAATAGKAPAPDIDEPGNEYELAQGAQRAATLPATKALTYSPFPEESVLGKVPLLGYGLTAADIGMNIKDGEGVKGVVEPVGNLVIATEITEATGGVIAGFVQGAAGSLALEGAAAALVPGVGEVVLVGAVAVVGTYLADKGIQWVWKHGGSKLAGEAWDETKDLTGGAVSGIKDGASWVSHQAAPVVHTAKTVIHDAEPWHWHL